MKKYIAILLVLIMTITVVGCRKNEDSKENKIDEQQNVQEESQEENKEDETAEPGTKESEVTLYFGNNEYIETGDESIEMLAPEKVTIESGNMPLEEAIVRELMKGPKSDKLSSSIPSTAKLLGVEVTDGTAFVNFAQEGLYGSSLQEFYTISQIVNSLLELDNVDKVQFLIDGNKAETLMGHYTITDPFDEPLN